MLATNIWFWVGFIAFVLAMLAIDLGVFNRRPHVVGAREALTWTTVWVVLALLFAAGLAALFDRASALTFLTGYVIEESLSVDNIFIIVLIFQYFAVPAQYQHRVLFWGILGALVMRGLFVGLGAALLAREVTDLIFAIDSIPAIFGITRDPFLVFTSNIFAVLGLRSLFFLLANVVTKFHLLKYGLAIILSFVGAKMLAENWIHVPITVSLGIVLAVLALSIIASLLVPKRTPATERPAPGSHDR